MNSTMKKGNAMRRFSLLLGLLASFLYGQAQNEAVNETTVQTQTETKIRTSSSGPRAGIKGGLNLSNFITDEVHDDNARTGFHVGVYGQLFSSDAFAIQPEVNYATKGNRVTFNEGIIDQENKFNLNYIDVPILAVFKLGNKVEIHAGPYWSYLVGANVDTDGDIDDGFYELDRDNFDKWDYGLVGGIGFNINNMQIGARYNYGLNEIARSEGAKQLLGSDTKNSVGQIYLAINLAR
jgi:hypothetical protein